MPIEPPASQPASAEPQLGNRLLLPTDQPYQIVAQDPARRVVVIRNTARCAPWFVAGDLSDPWNDVPAVNAVVLVSQNPELHSLTDHFTWPLPVGTIALLAGEKVTLYTQQPVFAVLYLPAVTAPIPQGFACPIEWIVNGDFGPSPELLFEVQDQGAVPVSDLNPLPVADAGLLAAVELGPDKSANPSGPTVVNVTNAATHILVANNQRKAYELFNWGAVDVSLGFAVGAVVGLTSSNGIRLAANGGYRYDGVCLVDVWGITAAGASSVAVVEHA